MPEQREQQQDSFLSLPSAMTVVKGTAAIIIIGMCVSAGLAAYRVSKQLEGTDEEEIMDE